MHYKKLFDTKICVPTRYAYFLQKKVESNLQELKLVPYTSTGILQKIQSKQRFCTVSKVSNLFDIFTQYSHFIQITISQT